jgi:hypothetical protein
MCFRSRTTSIHTPKVRPSSTLVSRLTRPLALNLFVKARYDNLISHLPEDTSLIWGVTMDAANVSDSLVMSRVIFSAFRTPFATYKNITLRFLGRGNECVPPPLFHAHAPV